MNELETFQFSDFAFIKSGIKCRCCVVILLSTTIGSQSELLDSFWQDLLTLSPPSTTVAPYANSFELDEMLSSLALRSKLFDT